MQNNIPTVYISKINCYIIKSNILSTIFGVLYQKYIIIKLSCCHDNIKLSCCHGNTDANAFSVDQLLILLVKSMFGKYSRPGVAASIYFQ